MLSEKSKNFDKKSDPNQSKPNQSKPNQSNPNSSNYCKLHGAIFCTTRKYLNNSFSRQALQICSQNPSMILFFETVTFFTPEERYLKCAFSGQVLFKSAFGIALQHSIFEISSFLTPPEKYLKSSFPGQVLFKSAFRIAQQCSILLDKLTLLGLGSSLGQCPS